MRVAALIIVMFLACAACEDDTATPRPTADPNAPATAPGDNPFGTQPAPRDGLPPRPCSEAYPGVCIPPPPPDLDCADVEFRRFTVLRPDPHEFDRDRDGVGCEVD